MRSDRHPASGSCSHAHQEQRGECQYSDKRDDMSPKPIHATAGKHASHLPASHKRAPTLDPTALKSLTRLCTHSTLWTKVAHPMAAVCRLWRFSRTAVLANIQQEDLQRAAWLALTPPFLCFPYLAVHRILRKHSIPFEAKTSLKYAHALTHCSIEILTE